MFSKVWIGKAFLWTLKAVWYDNFIPVIKQYRNSINTLVVFRWSSISNDKMGQGSQLLRCIIKLYYFSVRLMMRFCCYPSWPGTCVFSTYTLGPFQSFEFTIRMNMQTSAWNQNVVRKIFVRLKWENEMKFQKNKQRGIVLTILSAQGFMQIFLSLYNKTL